MKIYVAHSSSFDYEAELYQIIEANFGNNHEFIFPHRSKLLLGSSKSAIASSHLILAEVSYASTGLGIELGWANSLQLPITCYYKANTSPSAALSALNGSLYSYTSSQELILLLAKELKIIR